MRSCFNPGTKYASKCNELVSPFHIVCFRAFVGGLLLGTVLHLQNINRAFNTVLTIYEVFRQHRRASRINHRSEIFGFSFLACCSQSKYHLPCTLRNVVRVLLLVNHWAVVWSLLPWLGCSCKSPSSKIDSPDASIALKVVRCTSVSPKSCSCSDVTRGACLGVIACWNDMSTRCESGE